MPAKRKATSGAAQAVAAPAVVPASAAAGGSDVVVIASKECQVFKRRTEELVALIAERRPGTTVAVNPEKPLRCVGGHANERALTLLQRRRAHPIMIVFMPIIRHSCVRAG